MYSLNLKVKSCNISVEKKKLISSGNAMKLGYTSYHFF